MDEVEAGATHEANVWNASNELIDEAMEDATMPLIGSDILQSGPNVSPRAQLSYQPTKAGNSWTLKVQGPPTTTPTPFISSSSQIAVHIKSSTSLSPSKPRPVTSSDRGLRPEPKPIILGQKLPVALPSPEPEMDGQPRGRGRPKGSKRGTSSTNAQGDAGESLISADQTAKPKRRGRPPRVLSKAVRKLYLQSNPIYKPFRCQWIHSPTKSCLAELQNFKTLQKHVKIVHGSSDPLVCLWGECAKKDISFENQADFEEHMEKIHLEPKLWERGEGYQNDGISELNHNGGNPPPYLFDASGNQVTPSIKDQRVENAKEADEREEKVATVYEKLEKKTVSDEEYAKQTLGIASPTKTNHIKKKPKLGR
ncbi:hypothetical protein F4819DRAFT_484337 [Hypoxylon fuscum]|nr:hypothetical protein F4819DRAFT_484337 [Hypoxylon fuscum]